ncbi:cytochrome P450 9e2-like [Vanessa tameamea]|uniref:unspecific monooxygenase n=1 Tax=Vanessa tameamea TaxID=334116 RepID=A0ABM4AL37_VANTA
MVILMIWIGVLLAALALYFRQIYSKFSKHGVKHMRIVPMFGNMFRVLFRRETLADDLDRLYYTFTKERFVGKYEFITPTLIIRDLELVKKITVKDFEYFLDHRGFLDEKVEPIFGRNIFVLKGQEWKDMRSMLSPAFTSSKIKLMIPFMEEVGKQMIEAVKKKINESDTGAIDVDCKDLTTRYSNDVIASCAFGLKVDSFTDEKNKFYEMGKIISTLKIRQILLFFLIAAFPSLSKKLKLTIFSKKTTDFFKDLVLSTMRDRKERNIVRPDVIHLLMEAKEGQLVHDDKEQNANQQDTGFATVEESFIGKKTNNRVWSEIDLVAQAVLFFLAGFDTISTAMSFALHELAIHPEIQERLVQEIKNHDIKNGGKLDFASIQSLRYLDMVTSEVLRLWPPGYGLDRICVKDYNMGKPNCDAKNDFIVRKGELIMIPTWCFHHDPKLFPDPMKFDPERFSDENKHNIDPTAYMPFGLGPRNCIASRFALCELKVLLYQIMLHIEIAPSVKTCLPAKLSTESFNPRLVGGYWLKFKIRS